MDTDMGRSDRVSRQSNGHGGFVTTNHQSRLTDPSPSTLLPHAGDGTFVSRPSDFHVKSRVQRAYRFGALALGLLASGGNVLAQNSRIEPTLQSRLTYTDNLYASSSDEVSDWILEVTPGLRMARSGAPLTGQLSAQFRGIAHADETDRNSSFLTLNGVGAYEAVSDRLFFDARANVSRDNRSTLSGRGTGDFLDYDSSNRTEQFGFGPRVYFSPFGKAEGSVAYLYSWLSGGGSIESRELGRFDALLRESNAFGALGWGLSYSNYRTRYSSDSIEDETRWLGRAALSYDISSRLRMIGEIGRESTNFSEFGDDSATIKGVGVQWSPSSRTNLDAMYEDRIFGNGYDVNFRHRKARSAFDVSFVRDIESSFDTRVGGEEERLYREFYDSLSSISDLVERELEARRLVSEQLGGAVGTEFVSNNQFLSRTARFGYTLVGRRSSLRLQYQQSDRERLGAPISDDPRDDLNNYDRVTERAGLVSFSRRLTTRTSGSASLTHSKSEGQGDSFSETDRTSITIGINTRLGESTTGGLVYRYQKADGSGEGADFTENAISASIGMRF